MLPPTQIARLPPSHEPICVSAERIRSQAPESRASDPIVPAVRQIRCNRNVTISDLRQLPHPISVNSLHLPSSPPASSSPPPSNGSMAYMLSLVVICLGALNNVVGKVRSKPLGRFNYFVALLNGVVYTATYAALTIFGLKAGKVSPLNLTFLFSSKPNVSVRHANRETADPSSPPVSLSSHASSSSSPLLVGNDNSPNPSGMSFPTNKLLGCLRRGKSCISRLGAWKYLFLCGILDGWGNLLGMIGQPYISGPLYTLMLQSIVPLSALMSVLALHRRYTFRQVAALGIVFIGFLIAWLPMDAQDETPSDLRRVKVSRGVREEGDTAVFLPTDYDLYSLLKTERGLSDDLDKLDGYLSNREGRETSEYTSAVVEINKSLLSNSNSVGTEYRKVEPVFADTGNATGSADKPQGGSGLPSTFVFALLCALSTLPTALSFVVKEKVIGEYNAWVRGSSHELRPPGGEDLADSCEISHDATDNSLEVNSSSNPEGCLEVEKFEIVCRGDEEKDEGRRLQLVSSREITANVDPLTETQEVTADGVQSEDVGRAKMSAFVVCAVTSVFQMITMPFTLPINTVLGQTNGQSLRCYALEAWICFRGNNCSDYQSPPSCRPSGQLEWRGRVADELLWHNGIFDAVFAQTKPPAFEGSGLCEYAFVTYVAYVVVNITFNLFLIGLLRAGSSLLAFMSLKAVLPVSMILFFAIPWPLLSQEDVHLTQATLVSLLVIGSGIVMFEYERQRVLKTFGQSQPPCCFPLSCRANVPLPSVVDSS